MRTKPRIRVLRERQICLCLVLLGHVLTRVHGYCSLCYNDGTPSLLTTGEWPGGALSCQAAQTALAFIDDTDACEFWQVEAFMYCGCPSYPASYCSMCADDAFDIPDSTKFKGIPFSSLPGGSLCVDSLFIPRSEGHCEDFQRAAHFCGCPNAPLPVCNAVCEPPTVSATATTAAADRLLPPSFTMTCQDMYVQSPFYLKQSECSNFQDPITSLIDESAYCCSSDLPDQPVDTCDLCHGRNLTNPSRLVNIAAGSITVEMTCQDVQALSYVVTDETYCNTTFLEETDLVEACCTGLSDPPSPSPSEVPTTRPTATPSMQPSEQPSSTNRGQQTSAITLGAASSDASKPLLPLLPAHRGRTHALLSTGIFLSVIYFVIC